MSKGTNVISPGKNKQNKKIKKQEVNHLNPKAIFCCKVKECFYILPHNQDIVKMCSVPECADHLTN